MPPLEKQRDKQGDKLSNPQWHSHEIQQMLRDLTENQGVDRALLLEGTGISEGELENPALRVSLEQELELYTRIAHHNRDPHMGLRHGRQMGVNHYGLLGQAMLASSTLRESMQVATRFASLISWTMLLSPRYENFQGQPIVSYTMQTTPGNPLALALEVEATFSSLHTLINQVVLEPFHFAAVYFSSPLTADDDSFFREVFGCPVYFDAEVNKVLLPRKALSRRLPYAAPENRELMLELCQKSVESFKQERGLIGALRGFIKSHEGGVPPIEEAARYFNQSSRSLRRHLSDLSTSYQQQLDHIRYADARQYLTATGLTIEVIARSLGYSDIRSFRTAFKRWSGMTPSEFRNREQGDV